jgi:hypothetical protein
MALRAPGELALVVPAVPIYLVATRLETRHSSGGTVWAAVHGPPFLQADGVALVYFLPGTIAILWVLARRLRAKRF